jgi:cellulose synthase/poly-beta-1,6-N-acetylglucosamine synthase-like glycosyltransferase
MVVDYLLILQVLFWLCWTCILYPHFVYLPSLRLLRAFGLVQSRTKEFPLEPFLPTVTLIISAFNEEECILEKLKNSSQIEYPNDKLSIVVVSDASTDRTDSIVIGFPRAKLFRMKDRCGKSSGLTQVVPTLDSDILLFSDANSFYEPDSVRSIVSHFQAPEVGYVVGVQLYVSSTSVPAERSESIYWNRELIMKQLESDVSSVVGGDGAIYALRRELFLPLNPNDVSDLRLPLECVLKGYRGVFEPGAVCCEKATKSFLGQFHRKTRIINRSLSTVARSVHTLNPFRVGIFAYQLFAHKVVRWFSPVFLLGLFVSSAILAYNGMHFYQAALLGQLMLVVLASLSFMPIFRNRSIVFLPTYFLLVNVAALRAILFLRSKQFSTWTPER